MKFEIKEQIKNPLLNREEFKIEVISNNTPQKGEIIEFLKKDSEVSVIKEIQGNFGRDSFNVIVFVYDSVEAKESVEYIPRKVRKKLEEEKKKAEEAARKAEEARLKEEEEKKKAEEGSKEETKGEVRDGN